MDGLWGEETRRGQPRVDSQERAARASTGPRAHVSAKRNAASPLSARPGPIGQASPFAAPARVIALPSLRHKLHSDRRLYARITTIRILVRIFVQPLTERRHEKMWPKGAGRIGAAAEGPSPSPSGRRWRAIGRPEGRPSFRTGYGPPDEGPHPNPLPIARRKTGVLPNALWGEGNCVTPGCGSRCRGRPATATLSRRCASASLPPDRGGPPRASATTASRSGAARRFADCSGRGR